MIRVKIGKGTGWYTNSVGGVFEVAQDESDQKYWVAMRDGERWFIKKTDCVVVPDECPSDEMLEKMFTALIVYDGAGEEKSKTLNRWRVLFAPPETALERAQRLSNRAGLSLELGDVIEAFHAWEAAVREAEEGK